MTRASTRDALHVMTDRLTAEFAGRVPAGTVARCVLRSREQLLRAGVRDGIVAATELQARTWLRRLEPPRGC